MKNIETLVEDIYELFNLSPIERDEKEVDELIDKVTKIAKVPQTAISIKNLMILRSEAKKQDTLKNLPLIKNTHCPILMKLGENIHHNTV